jgi:hypothetical protein
MALITKKAARGERLKTGRNQISARLAPGWSIVKPDFNVNRHARQGHNNRTNWHAICAGSKPAFVQLLVIRLSLTLT